MIDLKTCPECGVPDYVTREHLWLDNGDLVQSRDEGHRMIFFESENLDPLFRNIENIIGTPIEHMVITAVRREVRNYVSLLIPEEVKKLIHNKVIEVVPIAQSLIDVAKMVGHGHQEIVGYRYEKDENDYYTVTVSEPFSLPMECGVLVGTTEAVTDVENTVEYEQISENTYKITTVPCPHPEELKDRLWLQRYRRRSGGRELEKCPSCGSPKALGDYQWHLERGVILNKQSGRRMFIAGPNELDVIFGELERELGETIPRVVVEAQRRFAANGFYSLGDIQDVEEFGNQLALRGLGNLHDLKIGASGLSLRLDNAALPLLTVGMLQGTFDAARGVESRVEWELSDEGTLQVEVTTI
jgi:hypothetical protein